MAVNAELNEESLFAHNYLRERHGCPPLEYDEELAKSSQAFANKLANSSRLHYYYPTEYGENVAYRVRSRDANLTGRLSVFHFVALVNHLKVVSI
ncbi:unnamed protein product [Hydatigera taeniaeformis]|uniref:SCP domain-containing protein n=1 Tax=Hydatigena taeniaeformis TaxID=6205 RepID=A0A0R3WX33_HYDTA|nr:unnamed protein product [Hydatigera taeniaeformis]